MSGSWPQGSGASPSQPWDQNKVKSARNISGDLGLGERDIWYRKDRKKDAMTHACCLSGSFLKGVFLILATVLREDLIACLGFSKWMSAELFCELGSLSIAVT